MRVSITRAARSCVVGRALVAAGLLLAGMASSATASAYELRHTTSGTVVHWPSHEVTVEVDPSMTALPGAADAVVAALASWSVRGNVPQLAIAVDTTPSSPAVDGRNVVYYAPDGYPAAGSALAITLVSFDDVTGEIVDADIVLNGQYAFAVLAEDSAPPPGMAPVANDPMSEPPSMPGASSGVAQFDLIHVLSHETGHLLGLLDATAEPNDVMYVYTSAHDAARRAPAKDDIAGVDALYANAPPQAGCTVAAPGVASRAPWGSGLGSALGLAWVVIRRRRAMSRREQSSTKGRS
jgi:Matrixin